MRPTPANPTAWNTYLAEGNATQARKRVAADVILRHPDGRILLVNPTYKPGWDLPGGMSEANEAPDDTARREIKEELGLDIIRLRLLVIDWVPPHGPWDDQIAFIFDGGTLAPDQAAAIHPHDEELSELRFTAPAHAVGTLPGRLSRRFAAALQAGAEGMPRYLRDGAPLV
ncbi:NUDIX hydrolase [Streptomyces bingchenggensis BCW-1]|uniref:NUDIX hydrolase n=1 Tax=Streptomyces bingchenggensis (strain BCW-1) TaxID=749414 RepID=D7C545_STRBB|nr:MULTISPECIES: NUDIX hydrolase [Streptomyces]ADI08271.1 NUDIX hydrolase [Streptomyces bingchenggensis BCW-1]